MSSEQMYCGHWAGNTDCFSSLADSTLNKGTDKSNKSQVTYFIVCERIM